jgi:hypothetical protein
LTPITPREPTMLHHFHPTSTKIHANAPRITPTTPRTITGSDRFTQHHRQPKISARGPQTSAHRLRTIAHHF